MSTFQPITSFIKLAITNESHVFRSITEAIVGGHTNGLTLFEEEFMDEPSQLSLSFASNVHRLRIHLGHPYLSLRRVIHLFFFRTQFTFA
jgi:hypothetical protein